MLIKFRYLAVKQVDTAMEATPDLKQLTAVGIKYLPQAYLTEVADFMFFIRHKAYDQQLYDAAAIRAELRLMNTTEPQHLEAEFADFDQQYPKE